MHELSLVLSIVDLAEREAGQASASRIEAIELEIGLLSTVQPEAFHFAWQQGVHHTLLERAALSIHYTPGRARCLECAQEFLVENLYDPCPTCGSYLSQVLAGRDLRVKSLTVT